MLLDIYLDAIRNHASKIAVISDSDSKNRSILEKAKEAWREYEPTPDRSLLAGIDSSYNRLQFQGFHLYVIDAVCVNGEGNVLAKEFEHSIGVIGHNQLEARSMEMETNVASKAANQEDLILIDGSIISRFVSGYSSTVKSVIDLTREKGNVIFVSKTSDTREIFESLGSKVGDIHFFNHVSGRGGYSRPYSLTRHKASITVVFARLSDYTPLLKLEFPRTAREEEVKETLDKLAYASVSGYPYVLKLAHNRSVVTDNDIERLANIYGLKNEIGARAVLR